MNRSEFKAISIIADKLNWQNKPVMEVCETIKQMVRNQQALDLDTVGECDSDEETLLSIALWDREKITSTMYVSDYFSLTNWNCYINSGCDDITFEDFCTRMYWLEIKASILAEEYELENIVYEETIDVDYDYWLECSQDAMWIKNNC